MAHLEKWTVVAKYPPEIGVKSFNPWRGAAARLASYTPEGPKSILLVERGVVDYKIPNMPEVRISFNDTPNKRSVKIKETNRPILDHRGAELSTINKETAFRDGLIVARFALFRGPFSEEALNYYIQSYEISVKAAFEMARGIK